MIENYQNNYYKNFYNKNKLKKNDTRDQYRWTYSEP